MNEEANIGSEIFHNAITVYDSSKPNRNKCPFKAQSQMGQQYISLDCGLKDSKNQ